MNARPKRRGRRDDGRRSLPLDAAKCASTGEAPVADDIRFDRRNLDFVIFADQFPRGVRRESSAPLLAYARRVVAKLIGIVRKPTVVRLMPQLRPAGPRVLALFLFVRRGRLRRRARILIGSLKLEHQLDQCSLLRCCKSVRSIDPRIQRSTLMARGWVIANGEPNTRCISVAGSHIQNVRFGALLAANSVLFTNNVIDHFGDDAIDYAANNLAITHNTIHDNLDVGDGNHEDAMQGQNGPLPPGVAFNAFSNILIDSNLIVRQTDPQPAFPTYLQGIDAFDEDWTNVTVTNNVVITSACHGITFESIHNSLIADNTVVEDGLFPTPGCVSAVKGGGVTIEGPVSTK